MVTVYYTPIPRLEEELLNHFSLSLLVHPCLVFYIFCWFLSGIYCCGFSYYCTTLPKLLQQKQVEYLAKTYDLKTVANLPSENESSTLALCSYTLAPKSSPNLDPSRLTRLGFATVDIISNANTYWIVSWMCKYLLLVRRRPFLTKKDNDLRVSTFIKPF